MDTLLKILQTPLGTILALAGIAILFFAFFDVSRGAVKMRKTPKDGIIPAAIGAVLIIGGLLLSKTETATPVEASPTATTVVSVAFTKVPPAVPTDTPVPTETAVPSETATIPTATASPVPPKLLADGCIPAQSWQADSTDVAALESAAKDDNCWNLESLGMEARAGTLHLSNVNNKATTGLASGIYTPIGNESVIEYKVYVNSLYIVYKDNGPAYVTFGIAPQGNPMARSGSGRFKLQVKDTGNSPTVFFILADTSEANGHPLGTRHYEYKNTYNVRLEVKEISMDVFINNVDTKETISVPSGAKVLYIGYNLPLLAGADVEISDLTIDGVKQ